MTLSRDEITMQSTVQRLETVKVGLSPFDTHFSSLLSGSHTEERMKMLGFFLHVSSTTRVLNNYRYVYGDSGSF